MQPAYSQLSRGGDQIGLAWSPNGSQIAYFSDGAEGIRLMNADGSADTKIAASGYDPSWSPDSRRIAVDTTGPAIWAANADGSNSVFLADGEARNGPGGG